MKYLSKYQIVKFILPIILILFAFSTANCAEIEDSTVFIEAFNAYQQKDYLLSIEKCDQLNQVFPDSPLRDVTLLLIARASLKAGDNARAAKTITIFFTEFPESTLKTSVEDELKTLMTKHKKGDVIPANKALQTAARKIQSERVARQRAFELKIEMERVAKAKAEQERIAEIKREEERRERERVQLENLAKASIKANILLDNSDTPFAVGSSSTLPIEISNSGTSSEEFLVSIIAKDEYAAALSDLTNKDKKTGHLNLAAGETFKGLIAFKMPANMVDGHRSLVTIKVVSARFNDISFQKDTTLISSAPLVRTIAKLVKTKVAPGERVRYKVAVLNAGSLSANDLTLRLKLPSDVDFQGAPDALFKQESDGTLIFKIASIDSGKLSEINLDVKIREKTAVGKVLRGNVEIIYGDLQRREAFTAIASTVSIN